MRFETKDDLNREINAIRMFVDTFGGYYKKLGEHDVDFAVYDRNERLIAYAEVKGRNRKIDDAFPLPCAARKLVKLSDKKINPVIIWDCLDGIIYGKLNELEGVAKNGGRKPRNGASNDVELMVYFHDFDDFKVIRRI